ncbi:hypothetical protein phiK7A1_097c [Pseudomonas phage phiK7A1]|uniref:Uncharacterized protein n=1 Tax=Pseudomonas phage phiK7A1 TaxID=2759194 RepID=A0A7H0XFU5_9CAUD|nr:hypothetical protein phiK7A1_097c [Pseudomonas phage phiK7A1]
MTQAITTTKVEIHSDTFGDRAKFHARPQGTFAFELLEKGNGTKPSIMCFDKETSIALRDLLLLANPLPTVTGNVEPTMAVVGELASFSPAQGITINIAHLTVNA